MKIGNVRIGGKVQAAVAKGDRIIPLSSVKGFQEKYGNAVTDDIIRNPEMLRAVAELADQGSEAGQIKDGKISFAPVVMQPEPYHQSLHFLSSFYQASDERIIFENGASGLSCSMKDSLPLSRSLTSYQFLWLLRNPEFMRPADLL